MALPSFRVWWRSPPFVSGGARSQTSITIPDVSLVIDCGRVKQMAYEPGRMSTLADVCVSAAQAKQRRGRAGRVRHGVCYHLFPSDADLVAQTEAEVRRVSLERLVMSTKALGLPGSAADILSQLPEPPTRAATSAALRDLSVLGAISPLNESLTALGRLLVELPVQPRLAKLCLLGVCFGAPDEALTIAAALSTARSPFLAPVESMEARTMDTARRSLAHGTQSDHVAMVNAYRRFFLLPVGIDDQRGAFARRAYLNPRVLDSIRTLKAQLLAVLYDAKLVTRSFGSLAFVEDLFFRKAADAAGGFESAMVGATAKGPSAELITALVSAAFHPQLGYMQAAVDWQRRNGVRKSCVRVAAPEVCMRDIRLLIDDQDSVASSLTEGELLARTPHIASTQPLLARVHPSSVGSRLNASGWSSPYLAFQLRHRDLNHTPLLHSLTLSTITPSSTL